MEDDLGARGCALERGLVPDVALDELGVCAFQVGDAPCREIIEDADGIAALGEQSYERRADEPGATGNQCRCPAQSVETQRAVTLRLVA
jgi:hypothetical protein